MAARSALARRREATTSAILEATSALIAEKGVDGFTLSEVGKRAQVNRALIYHYFRDRDNLIDQAINYILDRHLTTDAELNADSVEEGVRVHVTHPEIARFFFQMLLNGRSLGRLGQRMTDTAAALEEYRKTHAPGVEYDSTFALVVLILAQLSWAFSRKEMARLLGMAPEEADERFIAYLRSAAGQAIATMTGNSQ